MSKKKENHPSTSLRAGLVPRLRFPAYVKHKEWNLDRLDNIYYFVTTNSYSRDDLNYLNGEVKNIHYGDIHTKFSTLFDITKENVPFINKSIPLDKFKNENYCKEGDVVFADASEDLKDVGKSLELVNLNNEKLLSGLHTLLARQLKLKLAVGFGGYLFLNDRIRKQIQRESQGAKVLGISATRLSNINIFYPEEKEEQQKIASCLSSLDELITAEKQKLEVLKEHKKGLLQNLFPQLSELGLAGLKDDRINEEENKKILKSTNPKNPNSDNVPKLRFKEFEESGEWEVKKLGEVALIGRGKSKHRPRDAEFLFGGQYPFIQTGDIKKAGLYLTEFSQTYSEEGLKQSKLWDENTLCITIAANIAETSILKIKACFPDSVIGLITDENKTKILFVKYLFDAYKEQIQSHSQGVAQENLNQEKLSQIIFRFPCISEQQRIASCLSSLDDLINAQTPKIELLQLHKKGLLQGLFPNINEGGNG